MFVESKKYVIPAGSSRVSFSYSLESEGRPNVFFGKIVVLGHLLDAVAAHPPVGDHVRWDTSTCNDGPSKANLGVYDDRSVVIVGHCRLLSRRNAREKRQYPSPAAVNSPE